MMYPEYAQHSEVPLSYPIALNGLGNSTAAQPKKFSTAQAAMQYARKVWAEVQDYDNVTSADYNAVEGLLRDGRSSEAVVLIESLRARRPAGPGFLQQGRRLIGGASWGWNEKLIADLPNWALYSAVGVFAILGFRSAKKRKR